MRLLSLLFLILSSQIVLAPAPTVAQEPAVAAHPVFPSGHVEPQWRMTRYGWQNASTWNINLDALGKPIERIHPILFGINILLATLFALIWCSDEWQVARLMGRKS